VEQNTKIKKVNKHPLNNNSAELTTKQIKEEIQAARRADCIATKNMAHSDCTPFEYNGDMATLGARWTA
jgi:hypothetical protein